MAAKRKITGNAKKLTRKIAKGLGVAVGKTKGTTSRKILADEVRAAKPIRSKTGMSGRHFTVYQAKRTAAKANLTSTLRSNNRRVTARLGQAARKQAPASSHLAASVHKKFGSAGVQHLNKTQGTVKKTTGLGSRVAAASKVQASRKLASATKGKLLTFKTKHYSYLPTKASAHHLRSQIKAHRLAGGAAGKGSATGAKNRQLLAAWIKAHRS